MKYQVRVSESDDQILSVKLCEYSELHVPVVITEKRSPGILRTWRGAVGITLATIGWTAIVYVIFCAVVRVWQ